MVVGGLLIEAARRLKAAVEEAPGGTFADTYVDYALEHNGLRIDQQFEAYQNVHFDDKTYKGDAYPAYGWAACRRVDGWTRVRSRCATSCRPMIIGHVIHQVLAEGQVEGGTLQAVGYATIEEIKLVDRRCLNDRLATVRHPDGPRRAAHQFDPRRRAVQWRAARRKGVGELPMNLPPRMWRRRSRRDRRLDSRPAGVARAHPLRGAPWHHATAAAGHLDGVYGGRTLRNRHRNAQGWARSVT